MCKKVKYRTYRKATKALSRTANICIKQGRLAPRRIYKCPLCGWYHMTKQQKEVPFEKRLEQWLMGAFGVGN